MSFVKVNNVIRSTVCMIIYIYIYIYIYTKSLLLHGHVSAVNLEYFASLPSILSIRPEGLTLATFFLLFPLKPSVFIRMTSQVASSQSHITITSQSP